MKNYTTPQLVCVLTPFVISFAFGLDIYIPIVPQMAQIFHTTPALVQLTLSLFLLTTGVGQLVVGPLSDHFGRKPIFYVSSTFYLIGSLACAFSHHINGLIIARLISALGACGMLVTSFAVVRDLFSKDKSAQMYSLLNGAMGISPTFAPIFGGYLVLYFGWHSVFIFLACIGIFAILITRLFIKETYGIEYRVKINQNLFKCYWHIFTDQGFLLHSTLAGLAESVFFCFFSISPFIIIELFEVPPHEFGYYFAVFGLVIALGGVASSKILAKIGIMFTMGLGLVLILLGGLSMLIWSYLGLTLASFLIPMAIACTGAMFVLGGATSAALEPFGFIAGTASAAFGALTFGMSAAFGSILMLFPVHTTVPYGICILCISTLSIILFICITLQKVNVEASNTRFYYS